MNARHTAKVGSNVPILLLWMEWGDRRLRGIEYPALGADAEKARQIVESTI